MRFAALFAILVNLTGCGTFKVSDIGPMIQLPASKACFQVFTLSGKERFYTPVECEKIKSRSVLLTPEAWATLRADIQSNCLAAKCKQITGAVDGLFLTLDAALQKIPTP